eukprot:12571704-Ditylum_brightwellii.AAC.1
MQEDFPIGSEVVLDGLVKGAQYNGKKGTVKSILTASGRQEVHVAEMNKTLALKPSNLQYQPKYINALSVKELKVVLGSKGVGIRELVGLDKSDLASMVSEKSDPVEVAGILAKVNAPPTPAPAATTAASSSNFNNDLASQAEQVANMDPEQMRRQAQMMRSMDPAMIRRMNPQMAGLTDQQIRMAADQMEMMASNPSMMKSM